ncbi:MAG: DUF86 domain-containing protein [Fibrobacterales bacterium]
MLADPKNDMFHFLSILESIGKIRAYIKGISTPEEFFETSDQMVYNAVLTLLTNIGETVGKMSEDSQVQCTDIANIKALRNRIAHNYTGIDSFIIYDVATIKLSVLGNEIFSAFEHYLKEKVFDSEEYMIAKESTFYRHIDFDKIKQSHP